MLKIKDVVVSVNLVGQEDAPVQYEVVELDEKQGHVKVERMEDGYRFWTGIRMVQLLSEVEDV